MRGFRQRIYLIHELTKLAAPKEITDYSTKGLGIHQLGWCHSVGFLIKQGHAFLHQSLGASKPHPALVRNQLTHRAHTSRSQVINIVQYSFTHLELKQITRGFCQIVLGQGARFLRISEIKLLTNLVPTHTAQIIPFRVKKQTLQKCARICHSRRVSRAQTPVNFL